jgi:hypothetical protein
MRERREVKNLLFNLLPETNPIRIKTNQTIQITYFFRNPEDNFINDEGIALHSK